MLYLVNQTVQAIVAGKRIVEGFGRYPQNTGLADPDIRICSLHPTRTGGLAGHLLPVDVEAHHAIGPVVAAGNMVPPEQGQMVGIGVGRLIGNAQLVPNPADSGHETRITMTVHSQEITVVVSLLHNGRPVPGIGAQGKPRLKR